MNASDNQTAARNKEIIRSLYEDCLNTGNLDMLHQFVSKSYSGPHGDKGPEGFAGTIRLLQTAFPDIHWQIQDLVAEGNNVAIRWTWQGTHLGPFRHFPASGKQISDQGIAIYKFDQHKIISVRLQTDRLGFLQKIGVMPEDFSISSSVKTDK